MKEVVSKATRPSNLAISLVKGCNKRCLFCGIQSLPKGSPFVMMEDSVIDVILDSLINIHPEWVQGSFDFSFGGKGEPSLNPNCLNIFRRFHENFPKIPILIFTNGWGICRDGIGWIDKVFETGVNTIALDLYRDKDYEKTKKLVDDYKKANPGSVCMLGEKEKGSPFYGRKGKKPMIYIIPDFGTDIVKNRGDRELHNFGGEAILMPKPDRPLVSMCARPFTEMEIGPTGNVFVCCYNGFTDSLVIGNLKKERSLDAVWNSDLYNAIRRMLYHKDRSFVPCGLCSYKGGWCRHLVSNLGEVTDADRELVYKHAQKIEVKHRFFKRKDS